MVLKIWSEKEMLKLVFFYRWSSGTDQRHFYVNRGHGGCPVDIGWLSIKDSGNHCPWETSHQIPAFVYSKSETMINWQGAGKLRMGRSGTFCWHTALHFLSHRCPHGDRQLKHTHSISLTHTRRRALMTHMLINPDRNLRLVQSKKFSSLSSQ